MIQLVKVSKNSKRKMWCNVCGAKEGMGIHFSPNENANQGIRVVLCKDCMRELASKVDKYLSDIVQDDSLEVTEKE